MEELRRSNADDEGSIPSSPANAQTHRPARSGRPTSHVAGEVGRRLGQFAVRLARIVDSLASLPYSCIKLAVR